MKKLYFLFITILITSLSFGQVINEFQPNAAGTDPDPQSFELKGTPSSSFSGYLLSIESDGANGTVDRSAMVSGTFDANGLLVVTAPDLENPSFTLVLCQNEVVATTDLDVDNNGVLDDISVFGIVYDAIGIPDATGDEAFIYGAVLGGSDFTYTGDEPQLVFRDGATDDWYAVNDSFGVADVDAFDINGAAVSGADFDVNPTGDGTTATTTFGSINPIYTMPTGPVILVGDGVDNLDYEVGFGPSAEGTFTVEGTSLTDNILVTAPTDYEVSLTSGSGFGPSVLLTQASGVVASTTIYARLKSGLAINTYFGDVSVTSTGATTKTVELYGDVYAAITNSLVITGVFDGPMSGGLPKLVEIYVINDVADLSIFGIGSANNGGGTDGQELSFQGSATAGDYFYVGYETANPGGEVLSYFGITADHIGDAVNVNGDDAIELFENNQVIDTFGDINTDGTGEAWEHLDGWAYRVDGTGPDGATFVLANWTFSGINATDGCTDNTSCSSVFPIGTYSTTASTEPTLDLVDGPANGTTTTFPPQEAGTPTIYFAVTNFTVGVPSTGDGYIVWNTKDSGGTILESGQVQDIAVPITPTFVAGNTYSLNAELVDNSGVPLVPPVVYSITATFEAYIEVADLAALRAETTGDNYYHVTGEIIGTYSRSNRNQKYAQDASGGILIDDNDGVINTVYNEGDGITGLKGQLSEYLGVLQLVPTEDPGAATSSGNTIVPEVVTIADLLNGAATDVYESELVEIKEVTFTETGTFASSTNYTINDASTVGKSTASSMTLRTSFFEADYIGAAIPTETLNLTVFVAEFNGTAQVVPRTSTDILLGVKRETIDGFALYPNPVSNGFITINTPNNLEKNVNIFDVLGKQVYSKTIQNGEKVDVSNLNSGVYILRVEEDAKIATRKLIIR